MCAATARAIIAQPYALTVRCHTGLPDISLEVGAQEAAAMLSSLCSLLSPEPTMTWTKSPVQQEGVDDRCGKKARELRG